MLTSKIEAETYLSVLPALSYFSMSIAMDQSNHVHQQFHFHLHKQSTFRCSTWQQRQHWSKQRWGNGKSLIPFQCDSPITIIIRLLISFFIQRLMFLNSITTPFIPLVLILITILDKISTMNMRDGYHWFEDLSYISLPIHIILNSNSYYDKERKVTKGWLLFNIDSIVLLIPNEIWSSYVIFFAWLSICSSY